MDFQNSALVILFITKKFTLFGTQEMLKKRAFAICTGFAIMTVLKIMSLQLVVYFICEISDLFQSEILVFPDVYIINV